MITRWALKLLAGGQLMLCWAFGPGAEQAVTTFTKDTCISSYIIHMLLQPIQAQKNQRPEQAEVELLA